MLAVILSAWLWLNPSACGGPANDAAVEVAPMPRAVPVMRVPETGRPRIVVPPPRRDR